MNNVAVDPIYSLRKQSGLLENWIPLQNDRNFADMKILVGKTDLESGEFSAQTHQIEFVYEHPGFKLDTMENDVAVLMVILSAILKKEQCILAVLNVFL